MVVVPVLRAGLGMLDAVLELLPRAKVGHIGLQRDEETAVASKYYAKFPVGLADARVLMIDPMLATGGSAVFALDLLRDAGARDIRLLCIVAAPEGVKTVEAAYPGVHIYTPVVDAYLNAEEVHRARARRLRRSPLRHVAARDPRLPPPSLALRSGAPAVDLGGDAGAAAGLRPRRPRGGARRHRRRSTLLVHAQQRIDETEWMLGLAAASRAHRRRRRLGAAGRARSRGHARRGCAPIARLRGVRHIVHDEPDDDYLLRDDVNRGVARLRGHGLVYDVLIFAKHLPQAIAFVDRHPDQPFVVDHVAKPTIRAGHVRHALGRRACARSPSGRT